MATIRLAKQAEPESQGERLRFASWLTGAWALLTVPRLLTHELWRDEAWQWLVVLESRTLGDLFDGMSRGGGSGYLFPILCFLARQVSTSPVAMQLVQLALAAAAVFVFARWAPLGRTARTLFVLGYFPFFEYALISRSYALGALLLWLACAASRSRRPALGLGAALGLLCQTTVYGCILAVAVGIGWLYARRQAADGAVPIRLREALGGAAFGAAGAIAGLVQLHQAPGTRTLPWHFEWQAQIARAVGRLPWRALLPLPQPQLHFWNTNLLDPWPAVEIAAALAALVLATALLWRSRVALVTFAVGTMGLLAFAYAFLPGQVRHQGQLWMLFAAALWLGGGAGFESARATWRSRALVALLLIHCVAGAFASWMDLRHAFSNGDACAELIRRLGLEREPLLGHREPPAATVALHLGRPLYSPSRKVFTTHPDWGPLQREMSDDELRCAAREFARQQGRDVVLVMNHRLPAWDELVSLGATSGAIEPGEDYSVYRLPIARLARTAAAASCPGEPRSAE